MTVLVARKPMRVAGEDISPGDAIDPSVLPGSRAEKLIDQGLAYFAEKGTMSISDKTPPGKSSGNGVECGECGKVLKTVQGVKLHHYRVHQQEE